MKLKKEFADFYKEIRIDKETNALREWEHNKTIQKSVESFRIPKERKEYLKSLKRTPEKQR